MNRENVNVVFPECFRRGTAVMKKQTPGYNLGGKNKEEALNKNAFRAPLRSGFTLVELLIVVLIIGILTSIAVPQYEKAVLKSRYTQAMALAEKINEAQQQYRMKNDEFTTDFSKLNIEMPENYTQKTTSSYYYSWGYCWLHASPYAACEVYLNPNKKTPVVAYVVFSHFFSGASTSRQCWVTPKDDSRGNDFCKRITNNPSGSVSGIWTQYGFK